MTECTGGWWRFPAVQRRKVEVDFAGGEITSDAGALLLRLVDERLGLTARLARALPDVRRRKSCTHRLRDILRQRIYGIAAGYEDGNDHLQLRHDPALQTAVGTTRALSSPSTLCRLENAADAQAAWRMHGVLVDGFIGSFRSPPSELILDFDATDIGVHGDQEGRAFNAFYDHHCFLPLYVFCGEQLLVGYLRPSRIDAAKHAWGILALLVGRLRAAWPGVRLIFRGDSGFCRHRMLDWCDRHDVGYIVGVARNPVLERLAAPELAIAKARFEDTGQRQTRFSEDTYAAKTWKRSRRLIIKAEHLAKGANPRFLVTNLPGDPEELYRRTYCPRGDMENRIKEQQLDLFADRTSCHRWWANQYRLLLAGFAYVLLQRLRAGALAGGELARASCGSIRLKLLKIGAVVVRNTRRIRLHLSSSYPYAAVFRQVARRLAPDTS